MSSLADLQIPCSGLQSRRPSDPRDVAGVVDPTTLCSPPRTQKGAQVLGPSEHVPIPIRARATPSPREDSIRVWRGRQPTFTRRPKRHGGDIGITHEHLVEAVYVPDVADMTTAGSLVVCYVSDIGGDLLGPDEQPAPAPIPPYRKTLLCYPARHGRVVAGTKNRFAQVGASNKHTYRGSRGCREHRNPQRTYMCVQPAWRARDPSKPLMHPLGLAVNRRDGKANSNAQTSHVPYCSHVRAPRLRTADRSRISATMFPRTRCRPSRC